MTPAVRFPDQVEVIRRDAEAFRRLTLTERLMAIFDLIASGCALMEHSPHREAAQRLRDEQEADWQRTKKELFAQYLARQDVEDAVPLIVDEKQT